MFVTKVENVNFSLQEAATAQRRNGIIAVLFL
jgi:hypothetical protein